MSSTESPDTLSVSPEENRQPINFPIHISLEPLIAAAPTQAPDFPNTLPATASKSTHTQRHPSHDVPSNSPNPYRHPPVTFTDSELLQYNLPLAQLNHLTSTFDRVARVSIKSLKQVDARGASEAFPISVIMSCGLAMFYNWYSQTSSDSRHRPFYFDLICRKISN